MSFNFVSLSTDAVFAGLSLTTKQMPMNPLGNKEVERAISKEDIEELNRKQAIRDFGIHAVETQRTDVDKEAEDNMPWSEIMNQLQLKPTGDEEEDFNNIMDEIRFQIDNAQSQYDLNYYEWLMEHTSRMFMEQQDAEELYSNDMRYFENLSRMQTINMRVL